MESTSKNVKANIRQGEVGRILEIKNDFKCSEVVDVLGEYDLSPTGVENLIKRLSDLNYYKGIVENEGGFFYEGEWHWIFKEVPEIAYCHNCGTPNTIKGIGMKMYENKPTCTYCRLGIEKHKAGDNVRP